MFNSRTGVTPRRIVIAGGTGQLGRLLAAYFHTQGVGVTVLARHLMDAPWRVLEWNSRDLGGWAQEIDGAEVVINLAGRSVNCRYTRRNRREIMESRVLSTRVIARAIAQAARPPALWMNASTATIYRHAFDRPMDEINGELGGLEPGAPDSWKFSIDVAKSWEQEFFSANTPVTRKIALRSAMVMSPDRGGVFNTLQRLAFAGLGGRACSGKQFVSWIHHTDFVGAIDFLITKESLSGPVNLASPHPLPYRDFMRILRLACGVPFGLSATKWMLEIGALLLRTETELVLKSRCVIPRRLLEAGFQFFFPDWQPAAADLVDARSRLPLVHTGPQQEEE